MHTSFTSFHRPGSNRGSVLFVALILAACIAISLGSYLQLARTANELSHRAYNANVATNLAETGLELAMRGLNGGGWGESGWLTPEGGNVRGIFTGIAYEGNTTGNVRVFVENNAPAPGTTPVIFSRSTLTPYQGNSIEKWLQVECALGSSPWVGVVAQTMGMSGGAAEFDSYRSVIGGTVVEYKAPLPSDPSQINRSANITLLALSVEADSVDASNSKIFGYIAVGSGEEDDGVAFHKNAMLTGDFNAAPKTQDPDRITYDAKLSIPRVTQPAETNIPYAITSATELDSGTYTLSSIELSGEGNDLVLKPGAKVTLLVPTTSLSDTVVKIGGNAQVIIPADAELEIYTPGNVSITGTNVVNSGIPKQLRIYGTRDRNIENRQTIDLGGQGELFAIVHAPDANITLNGGGSDGHFYGALVGHHAQLNGGAKVTWDETLEDETRFRVWRMSRWVELTSATARAAVSDKLNF